jgi:large subunit ribosomal protein L24e
VEDLPRKGNPLRSERRQTFPLPQQENERLRTQVRPSPCRKLKAQRLRWTTAWRRLHKKLKQTNVGKNKKNKAFRKERAIEGVTLDDIRKLKTARPEDKKALAEEAVREIKERKKALAAKKAGVNKTGAKDKNAQQKAQDKAAQKAQKKVAAPKAKK